MEGEKKSCYKLNYVIVNKKIKNPIFEFHIIHEKEEKFYLKMIKDFKPL